MRHPETRSEFRDAPLPSSWTFLSTERQSGDLGKEMQGIDGQDRGRRGSVSLERCGSRARPATGMTLEVRAYPPCTTPSQWGAFGLWGGVQPEHGGSLVARVPSSSRSTWGCVMAKGDYVGVGKDGQDLPRRGECISGLQAGLHHRVQGGDQVRVVHMDADYSGDAWHGMGKGTDASVGDRLSHRDGVKRETPMS